jgi:protein-disulfide isomerase
VPFRLFRRTARQLLRILTERYLSLALGLALAVTSGDLFVRAELYRSDKLMAGHTLPVLSGAPSSTGADGASRPCHLIRFESRQCGLCASNRRDFGALVSEVRARGGDVNIIFRGPLDGAVVKPEPSTHRVDAVPLDFAEATQFSRTPTTVLTDGRGRILWGQVGVFGPADIRIAVARLDSQFLPAIIWPMERHAKVMQATGQLDRPAPRLVGPSLSISFSDSPSLGPTDAAIRMVEFSDFECPFCRRAARELHRLLAAHPTQVSLTYKFFPLSFHRHSKEAAYAAAAAQWQGRFWQMHDSLFEDPKWLLDASPAIAGYAESIGLDKARFRQDLNAERSQAAINADEREAGRLGVTGTPTLFINGRRYAGPATFNALQPVVAEILASAQ